MCSVLCKLEDMSNILKNGFNFFSKLKFTKIDNSEKEKEKQFEKYFKSLSKIHQNIESLCVKPQIVKLKIRLRRQNNIDLAEDIKILSNELKTKELHKDMGLLIPSSKKYRNNSEDYLLNVVNGIKKDDNPNSLDKTNKETKTLDLNFEGVDFNLINSFNSLRTINKSLKKNSEERPKTKMEKKLIHLKEKIFKTNNAIAKDNITFHKILGGFYTIDHNSTQKHQRTSKEYNIKSKSSTNINSINITLDNYKDRTNKNSLFSSESNSRVHTPNILNPMKLMNNNCLLNVNNLNSNSTSIRDLQCKSSKDLIRNKNFNIIDVDNVRVNFNYNINNNDLVKKNESIVTSHQQQFIKHNKATPQNQNNTIINKDLEEIIKDNTTNNTKSRTGNPSNEKKKNIQSYDKNLNTNINTFVKQSKDSTGVNSPSQTLTKSHSCMIKSLIFVEKKLQTIDKTIHLGKNEEERHTREKKMNKLKKDRVEIKALGLVKKKGFRYCYINYQGKLCNFRKLGSSSDARNYFDNPIYSEKTGIINNLKDSNRTKVINSFYTNKDKKDYVFVCGKKKIPNFQKVCKGLESNLEKIKVMQNSLQYMKQNLKNQK